MFNQQFWCTYEFPCTLLFASWIHCDSILFDVALFRSSAYIYFKSGSEWFGNTFYGHTTLLSQWALEQKLDYR